MSFGWSIGDVANGVKLVYKVGKGVGDADKAPDEVKWAEETSRAGESCLGHVENTFNGGQPNSRVDEIRELAQHIAAREKNHSLKRYKRYGERLGRDVARRKLRALPEKIQWTLHGKTEEDKHQKDQQGSLNALHTGMLAHIVNQQNDHLTITERVSAQREAHFHALMKGTTDTGTEILQKLGETGISIQQQQEVLGRAIETKLTKLGDILVLIEQQFGCQRSSEELLQKFLQRLEPLIDNKINEFGSSQNPSPLAEQTLSNHRSDPGCRIMTSPKPYRATSSPKALGSTKRISVLRVGNRSVELAWQGTSTSTATALPTMSTNEGGVYLTLLLLMLAACCEIGLEMGRYISSHASKRRAIPAPVTFLLSDNIYFTDALGRDFRLCLDQTATWDMLNGWLREQFKGCPGSSKVQSGQFFIFDPQEPDVVISRTGWSKAVGPRRHFQMGIVFSHTQLSDHCLRCFHKKQRKPWIKGRGEFNVRCPACGTLYSSSALGSLRPTLSILAVSLFKPDEERPGRRRLPYNIALAQAPLGMRYLTEEFARLDLSDDDLDLDLDLDLALDLEIGHSRARPSWEDENNTSTIAYSHWKQEEYNEEPEEEPITYGPIPDMRQESDAEQRDFEYFKAVWINSDTRLHDAALRGKCSLARELIFQGHDPNQRTGSTGSPLVAAIVSGSYEMVMLLLDHGADPLLPVQQGHTPVSVSACHATDRVGHVLFPAAFHASYDRPADFQRAADRALYESATNRHDWHDFLLFIGANPAAPCPGPRQSAFAKALKGKDVALLKTFLMVLWERRILNRLETIILATTVKGEDISFIDNPEPWLRVCCAALAVGDAQPFVQEINKRIRKQPDLYFRLNIGNTNCHPDMQRFWRNCENERKGIVVPPELAGMGT